MATKVTSTIDWTALEQSVSVGDRWRFEDGETCIVSECDGGTVLCTSGIRYPVAAMVRTADKIAVASKRAA